ncbi:MAG: PAS domain-containing protein, partial [Thermomicrobiaceae bacterium]|nr:PAS domain-containing protein [Thermomicrobiaceae bacterium]
MARARAQVVTDERIDQVKGRPALLSGFLRFDRDHRVVFASAEVARVFGVSVSDIRGKTLADLGVPSESIERWERALATVFATGRETVVEFTQSAAGRTLRCRLVAEPGVNGGVDNVLALVQESVAPGAPAAWEDLVAELHAAHARLEAVIQQMPAGVIIAEAPSGRLILGNDQVRRIWRQPFYPSDSIPDYDAYRGFHPDGRPYRPEEWPLARSIATGEVVTDEEIEILRGDGTRGTILVSSAPIYGRDGRVMA